jgi:hypothetical protein
MRRYNHELDKEFNSPNALNVTKTSRLLCRPEDLPQKALFRAKPNGRRNQGRRKTSWADGVNSDSSALGVSDWTLCSRQADMERPSSTGINQVLVVVPHKKVSK